MRVLGIETSCDDTGIAIYDGEEGLLAHRLHSQAVHQAYGGVVPELASRDHIRRVMPLIEQTLDAARSGADDIDAIAYTAGPGLVGALMVGASVGASLAFAWGVPAIPVHHMEGHLLAPMLESPAPAFPFLALLVSGGHSMLVEVRGLGRYQTLGETLDDAAGEAFDKTAKLLGLGYPGGPALARAALEGDPMRFDFPRPMLRRPGLDFSFSGLKTAVAVTVAECERQTGELDERTRADVAAGFQAAVIDTLVGKSLRALESSGLSRLVVAGGVGANRLLRQQLTEAVARLGVRVYYPRPEFCTDNGAMIAYAGWCRLNSGSQPDLLLQARPRWPLDSLEPPAPAA